MLNLGERLQTVAAMVPPCHTMADIGTDHGYVPAWLVLAGKCRRAIASDIAEGPCQAAAETRNKYTLSGAMVIRNASGLQGLQAGEAEAVAGNAIAPISRSEADKSSEILLRLIIVLS